MNTWATVIRYKSDFEGMMGYDSVTSRPIHARVILTLRIAGGIKPEHLGCGSMAYLCVCLRFPRCCLEPLVLSGFSGTDPLHE